MTFNVQRSLRKAFQTTFVAKRSRADGFAVSFTASAARVRGRGKKSDAVTGRVGGSGEQLEPGSAAVEVLGSTFEPSTHPGSTLVDRSDNDHRPGGGIGADGRGVSRDAGSGSRPLDESACRGTLGGCLALVATRATSATLPRRTALDSSNRNTPAARFISRRTDPSPPSPSPPDGPDGPRRSKPRHAASDSCHTGSPRPIR